MTNLDQIYTIAISNVVQNSSQDYIYRKLTRAYSNKFNMSLQETRALPIEEVALDLYESYFEELDEEELDEAIERLMSPDYENDEEASIQEFIKQAETEEATKRAKKEVKKASSSQPEEQPVSKTYDIAE